MCDIPFDDILPEKCITLPEADHANDIDQFGDQLILASEDLAKGFDLAMIYYGHIDGLGHEEGPESHLIDEEIMRVDTKLGALYQSLDDLGIREETNVVFVSDHGMTSQKGFKQMDMTHFINPDLIDKAVERVAYTNIKLSDLSKIDEAMDSLSQWPGVDVYKKEDIPEHLHYQDNSLILDILVVSKEGTIIGQDYGSSDKFIPPAEPGDGGNITLPLFYESTCS